MKTSHGRLVGGARHFSAAAAMTFGIFSAALLGGVSVQAATTNYIWNVSSDVYTNDANWVAMSNSLSIGSLAPCGNGPGSLAAHGSLNYNAWVTNGGSISYGDGGGGPTGPYSWTNFLGQITIGGAANGAITMASGSLAVTNGGANAFMIGGAAPGAGSFTLNGGLLTAERNASTLFQDFLIVGNALNASGTLTVNGGLLMNLGGIEVGNGGSGTVNVNGGVLVDNGWFGVGRGGASSTNSSGAYNLTAGTMYILRNTGNDGSGSDNGLYLGQGSSNSIANISGGTLYCIRIGMGGAGAASEQTLNVSGGTLYVGYLGVGTNGTGMESANISGGTFHTADFQVISTAANEGNTNTITALGTNWTWGAFPTVNLTNNTYTVNGSTGPGYVTFAPEATRTITLNNQWIGVGGIVINGPGSVAMGEVNGSTYTGGTTLSQGTLIFNTAQPGGLISGLNIATGTRLALASAQTNPIIGVATIPGGSTLALNNNGVFFESPANIPAGVLLAFNQSASATVTNIFTGPGNIVMQGSGTVNVDSNLQNTGWIVQSNGALVINGTILNASGVTNNGPASAGPLCAQGMITPPLTISPNSAFDLGLPTVPGTLNASNVTINGTWNFKLNTATTVGGGVNDLLICSNLTLGASSVLNLVTLTELSSGSYVIAQYSGTLTGAFGMVSNVPSGAISVSYSTPGEVLLNVGSVTPSTLTWATPLIGGSNQWDAGFTTNWLNGGALGTYHQQDAVTFSDTPSTTLTNRVVVTKQMLPSSITISGGVPYIFSGNGYISGATGITYNDTNISGIYTLGNNFTGLVNINAGVLQLGSGGSSWLGATNGATIVNGGTLDLNGQGVGAEPLVIQGAGSSTTGTNTGAINNNLSSSPGQSAGPLNITLAGDATINASGSRWDIGVATLGAGGGSFTGNGHNLVKIGSQPIWMHEVGDIGVGNIDIQQGLLGFEFTIGMGNPAATVTVESGATLGLFSLNTNSILNKQMVLNGNATLQSGGNAGASNNFVGPITLNGTNAITTSSFPLTLGGAISGTGGLALTGTGPLYLGGVDTYSGLTFIGPGSRLVLNPGASIGNSSLIYLTPSSNTVLDAGVNTLTLNSGQTLVGAGSITATNFVAGSGATISPGTNLNIGTIVFTNNLTLNGNTNIFKIQDPNTPPVSNDLIVVANSLTLSGVSTIQIIPLTALSSSSPYTVMVANNGITGSAANLRVISTSPRYTLTPVINAPYVQLNVSGNAAPLEWKGYLTPNWDMVTSNWFNMSTASHDLFYTGDDPTFDDSASVTTVTITNNVLPSGIFMSNVVKTYTFNGGGVIRGQLNMYGNGSGTGGTLVLAMSNAPAFAVIDSQAGNLVYNLQGLSNYTVGASIEDSAFDGAGRITFGGTNTALLTADNYDAGFDGQYWVTNGVLRYTNQDAFGTAAMPIVVTNAGTLDFNGVPLSAAFNPHISGTGFNGEGAIFDSTPNQEPNGAFVNFTLDGDAVAGAPAGVRYDQHVPTGSPGQVNGQGFNFTFVGGGALFFNAQADGDTHFGNIDVATTNGGRLAFQGAVTLGLTDHYLFIETNAEVTFFSVSNGLESVHAGVDKILWMKGLGASFDSGGNSNNFVGPVFLTGTNLFGTRSDLHLWNTIMDTNGAGGFIVGNDSVGTGSGNLWLDGTNSYSGPTIVSNNTLYVGANSSLGLSTYVRVNSGATLDISAMPSLNFGYTATNEMMRGNGTINGPSGGNINFNAGGTLAVGLPTTNGLPNTNTFTLTINGNVVFNSGSTYMVGVNKTSAGAATNASDHVVGLTSVTMGGTLMITNYGTGFVGGDVIPLFSSATYNVAGFTSNNIIPSTPGPNLAWDTHTLGTDGNLRIFSTLVVNPNPTNIVFTVQGGTNLVLSWPVDHIGWTLQAETNSLSVGISNNWTSVNGSTTNNSFAFPINLTNGTVFFRLIYTNP